MPEKKRLLATVPKGGEWDPLSLDERKLVEEAYGQGPLSQVVWLKIEAATALYSSGAAVERAVPMDEFRRKLTKLRAAAGEVNRCLPEMSHRVYKTIDPQLTGIERQLAIQKKYFELDDFNPTPVFPIHVYELLSHTLAAVEDVASYAEMELGDPEVGYIRGTMWVRWVYWLTIIMREHELPHAARSDSDKRRGKMSPFVLLVQELQKHLSVETQQTISIPKQKGEVETLARAISRARHGMDVECKFTDVVDVETIFGDVPELRSLLTKSTAPEFALRRDGR
jgi:hypothetical protein